MNRIALANLESDPIYDALYFCKRLVDFLTPPSHFSLWSSTLHDGRANFTALLYPKTTPPETQCHTPLRMQTTCRLGHFWAALLIVSVGK
ncbi:hypothetical protein PO909_020523 [Leuciscus waleckii]